MKFLFISANNFKVPYPVYPLGISYLKSYLSKRLNDYSFEIFDMMNSSLDALSDKLLRFNPDYVGISLRNIDNVNYTERELFLNYYSRITELVRSTIDTIIIIGGSGYSIYPKLLFEKLKPDFGIHGEGEIGLLNLLNAIDSDNSYADIEGLVFKKNGKIIVNSRKHYLYKLNFEFDDAMLNYYWQNSGMLNIQSKRGCPYRCIYCTYPLIEGNEVRTLNSKNIVEMLSYYYKKKGINYFFFTDSVFNINNRFNLKLAKEIISSDIKINWGAYFSPRNLKKNFLALLKESGLTHIEFGTDSLSDTQLKNYGKQFSMEDVFNVSEYCNELDINYAHFLILGGYGETDDTIKETFDNSKRIKRTVYFPFIGMRIYPGTILQKLALKENVIKEEDDLIAPTYYVSKNFDIDSLKDLAKTTNKRWVFPDENLTKVVHKLRQKNKKGPLWEYIVK